MWRRLAIRVARLLDREEGQAYVEYVVLAAIAALVILAAVQYFFGGLSDLFLRLGDAVRGIG
jgi:Flp pilus assembly pilin Flp